MGRKQTSSQKAFKLTATIPINKNKTLSANLNSYIKRLKAKYSELSTKEYLALLHRYISRCTKTCKNISQKVIVQNTYKIRICKECDHWALNNKKMLQCIQCEDYYHLNCIKSQKEIQESQWLCLECEQMIKRKLKKSPSTAVQEKERMCSKCQDEKTKNKVMIKCLRCQNIFHEKCFGKKIVVCADCDKQIQSSIKQKPLVQITLRESFAKKEKSKIAQVSVEKKEQIDESTVASTTTATISKNNNFIQNFPHMTEQQVKKYRESLIYAIMSKKMKYTEELKPQNCELFDDNEDSLDFAISQLSYSDYRMYKKYKEQPIGPFKLQFKEKMGYDVIADMDLPKGMIVCEYVGDVYTHRQVLENQKENDSIMELKVGKNADQSLFIVPKLYSNIARFINGINNLKGGKKNIETMRTLANGRPVVILYTGKKIKKGESLIYDYNAGSNPVGYDTSEFV